MATIYICHSDLPPRLLQTTADDISYIECLAEGIRLSEDSLNVLTRYTYPTTLSWYTAKGWPMPVTVVMIEVLRLATFSLYDARDIQILPHSYGCNNKEDFEILQYFLNGKTFLKCVEVINRIAKKVGDDRRLFEKYLKFPANLEELRSFLVGCVRKRLIRCISLNK